MLLGGARIPRRSVDSPSAASSPFLRKNSGFCPQRIILEFVKENVRVTVSFSSDCTLHYYGNRNFYQMIEAQSVMRVGSCLVFYTRKGYFS